MQVRFAAVFIFASLLALGATPAQAAILTFNSDTPATNVATRADWLTAIGIAAPLNSVDFESGFSDGQNITGVSGLFPGGLVITDTGPGTPQVITRSGAGVIGGSNAVGAFSLTHDAQAFLVLDFSASPIDYLAFQDIDQNGTTGTVTFVGGGTAAISFEDTGTSGNTAEFFGIYRNDMPRITRIQLNASGDSIWGMDTIEYGAIPEPTSVAMYLFGLILTAAGREFGQRCRPAMQQAESSGNG